MYKILTVIYENKNKSKIKVEEDLVFVLDLKMVN